MPLTPLRYILLRILSVLVVIQIVTLVSTALASLYIELDIYAIALILLTSTITALGIIGLTLFIGGFVSDISKISLVISTLSASLMYLSPIYYPLEVLPQALAYMIMINPLTPGIQLLRNAIINNLLNIELTLYMLSINFTWLILGLYTISRVTRNL